MNWRFGFGIAIFSIALGSPSVMCAAELTREEAEFFEKQVRPILSERCYSCHSDAQKKTKGGLVVDSLAGLLQGGDSGPAIVPGEPDKSKLIEAIRYANDDFQMPPKGKLPEAEIDILTKWVKLGAKWPNAGKTSARTPGKITDDDRKWWAFQPVRRPNPPAVPHPASAIRNEIDRFVLAKLDAAKLTPAPEADRRTLIRRVTFDLTGLPPKPEEVDAFVTDPDPRAYETLVDRLLASPRFGERSARLWLDLVRYADSDGYRIDDYRPTAWRYRDYVIDAFNADKPYDRFIREQIAGDELFPDNPEATIATGYLRHWVYEYNQRDVRSQWNLILDDVTDTTGDVFLGLGLQCARCHDHKFDPILQKDYFRLRAFFANLLPRDDQIAATDPERAGHAVKMAEWESKTAKIRAELDTIEGPYRKKAADGAITKFPVDIQAMIRKPVAARTPYEHQLAELAYRQVTYEHDRLERNLKGADKERAIALRKELAAFDAIKPAPLPVAFSATDVGVQSPTVTIPKRGEAAIDPGYITLLDDKPATIVPGPASSGRRSALARWLTDPANPLTARVMVNRIWQQHFGRGLAANASDFGRLGDLPTHPELLDWLAAEFVAPAAPNAAWSMKHLHRLMVTSAAYRRTASHPNATSATAGRLADPENKLLWRGTVRRLDAEQIRDSLLAVTGELNLKAGGPGSPNTEPRRTIYTRIMRNTRDPLTDVFDTPVWFNSASSRDTTTTPVQSLLLFNGQTLLQRSRALAERISKDEPADPAKRIDTLYRLAFGRMPTTEERALATGFLAEQAKRIDPKKAGSAAAQFVAGKIPYRDGQAAALKLGTHVGFVVPHADPFPKGDFTIEAYISPSSVADSAAVRTIAAKWDGDATHAGWAFGITGKKSRRKPQTVVLQLFGKKTDGSVGEEAVFSDQHVSLNKPYYLAAAVTLADGSKPGQVAFYLKDLSNDDEPLLTAKVPHAISGGFANTTPMTIGNRGPGTGAGFDGLIDDIRISHSPLGVDQLLFTREGTNAKTIGYWQFEAKPNVFRDASGHGYDIRPAASATPGAPRDVHKAALADLCHVLLNASEFLYVE
jgi:Protein of unknown function (DUF1549)/Protein of unknown function (DUF1553)/Planctomycete cytochrome C/Concanavalin A-like lectin/glucanases superfamily